MISIPIWLFVLLCIPTAMILILIIIIIVQSIVMDVKAKAYQKRKQSNDLGSKKPIN